MEFKKLRSVYNNKKFVIDEDIPEVGFYLYVYDGDKCVYDCLQDTIEICKEVAFEEFQVPLGSWQEIGSQ
jgi:hypothetical protein